MLAKLSFPLLLFIAWQIEQTVQDPGQTDCQSHLGFIQITNEVKDTALAEAAVHLISATWDEAASPISAASLIYSPTEYPSVTVAKGTQ